MDDSTSPPTRMVLTQWEGQPPEDTTWESWPELRDAYHLEDKVVFGDGGIVSTIHKPESISTNQGMNFLEKKPIEFTPISMPYADLLLYLLNNAMAVISPAKISQPPFSRGYKPNMTCAYHGGVLGHSIEHCMTLKHKE